MSSKKPGKRPTEARNSVMLAAPRTSEGPISTLFGAENKVRGVCLRFSPAAVKGVESLKKNEKSVLTAHILLFFARIWPIFTNPAAPGQQSGCSGGRGFVRRLQAVTSGQFGLDVLIRLALSKGYSAVCTPMPYRRNRTSRPGRDRWRRRTEEPNPHRERQRYPR